MISDELLDRMRQAMGFEPTAGQAAAMNTFCHFIADGDRRTAMIMRGAAGTGKSSVAGAIVRAMQSLRRKVVLMAPTGRAAKIFSLNAGSPALTIHRAIYRQKTFTGDMSGFKLGFNGLHDALFIVDEASMIADRPMPDATFGSGSLLDDLVSYVYSGEGCRLMLIGDKAQLPPVGEEKSPALTTSTVEGYGLTVYECETDEVLRQAYGSGILSNATMIRRMLDDAAPLSMPRIRLKGFADIQAVAGEDLIEQLSDSYSRAGMDETIVITRSNKRAGIYNAGIRARVLDREDILSRGDMLMIVKNNYRWFEPFIANGDRAEVRRVRNVRELYGLHFADAELSLPDYDGAEVKATIVLDVLSTDAPALTREQQDRLFGGVLADYDDLPRKQERMKAVKEDKHYNALQVKYAYAVTCHKAQGGQWAHVYIDQGYLSAEMLTPSYIRWLYTAFTRATEKLFLINYKTQD